MLAKHIATQLEDRAFCVVFEDDLELLARQPGAAGRTGIVKSTASLNLTVGVLQL